MSDYTKFSESVPPQADDTPERLIYRGIRKAVDIVIAQGLTLTIFSGTDPIEANVGTLSDIAVAIWQADGDLSELASALS
jgi:hypothetical protein